SGRSRTGLEGNAVAVDVEHGAVGEGGGGAGGQAGGRVIDFGRGSDIGCRSISNGGGGGHGTDGATERRGGGSGMGAAGGAVEEVVDVTGACIERLRGEEVGGVIEGRVDLLTRGKAILRGR